MHLQPHDTWCAPLGDRLKGGAFAGVPYTSKLKVMLVSAGTPVACGSNVHR